MKEELKPCPFCGSSNAPKYMSEDEFREMMGITEDVGERRGIIICSWLKGGCGAIGSGAPKSKASAITVWNIRMDSGIDVRELYASF